MKWSKYHFKKYVMIDINYEGKKIYELTKEKKKIEKEVL